MSFGTIERFLGGGDTLGPTPVRIPAPMAQGGVADMSKEISGPVNCFTVGWLAPAIEQIVEH
jgi:hypothetical protein